MRGRRSRHIGTNQANATSRDATLEEQPMPRAGVTTDGVVDAAAGIANADGLKAVTLARLAEKLGIRSPSLYKHVDSLDAVYRALAVRGIRDVNARAPARHHRQVARRGAVRPRPHLLAVRPRAARPLRRLAPRRRPEGQRPRRRRRSADRHGSGGARRVRRERRRRPPCNPRPPRHHPRLRLARRRRRLPPEARPGRIVRPAAGGVFQGP